MLFALSVLLIIVFLLVNMIVFSAEDKAENIAPIILEQRKEYRGNIKFEHYFLANTGSFVAGVVHYSTMFLYSSVYSFCVLIGLICSNKFF